MSYPYAPPPPPNEGKRFLNVSVGVLVLAVAGIIILCLGACLFSIASTANDTPGDEPSSNWSAPRTVSCITCHG